MRFMKVRTIRELTFMHEVSHFRETLGERLFFHVLLNGVEGTAWFDDIRVEKVDP